MPPLTAELRRPFAAPRILVSIVATRRVLAVACRPVLRAVQDASRGLVMGLAFGPCFLN